MPDIAVATDMVARSDREAYWHHVLADTFAPVQLDGAVITEAGLHPAVEALAYITAFAPDTGESVLSLVSDPAPGAPVPPILPPREGYLLLDPSKFHTSFAADLDARTETS